MSETRMLDVLTDPCPFCGDQRIIAVPADGFYRWLSGSVRLQEAVPDLSEDDQEMLMTGIDPDCSARAEQ